MGLYELSYSAFRGRSHINEMLAWKARLFFHPSLVRADGYTSLTYSETLHLIIAIFSPQLSPSM